MYNPYIRKIGTVNICGVALGEGGCGGVVDTNVNALLSEIFHLMPILLDYVYGINILGLRLGLVGWVG